MSRPFGGFKAVSDDTLLQINSMGAAAQAVPLLLASTRTSDLFFGAGSIGTTPLSRHYGLAAAAAAGTAWAATTAEPKKNALKALGVCWLGSAAMHLAQVQDGTQRRDAGVASAIGAAVLGGINLAQGYRV